MMYNKWALHAINIANIVQSAGDMRAMRERCVMEVQRMDLTMREGGKDLGGIGRWRSNHEVNKLFFFYSLFARSFIIVLRVSHNYSFKYVILNIATIYIFVIEFNIIRRTYRIITTPSHHIGE